MVKNGDLMAFVAVYLLLTLALGWWASRKVKTASDFVLAGRGLPMFVAACALFATWFGSETVMGASSTFIEKGLPGIIEDPFGAALCLFLAGLLIAKPLYRLNLLTFSDFFRLRFSKTTEIVSAFIMVPSYFSWIAAQFVALAIILQSLSGLERHWGVMICAGLVLFYTYLGGMWSVAVTDFVQTIIIITGMLVLAVQLVFEVGGPQAMLCHEIAQKPDFFRFFPKGEPLPVIYWIAAWMTIGLGSIPQQDVFQRVMAARSERASIRASYLSAVMYLTVAFLPLIISYCGMMLYPNLAETGDTQQTLPNMVLRHSGFWMQAVFFGALLSAVLSTASGALLAPATVIGENMLRPLMGKNMTDKKLLLTLRLSTVGVAVVTAGMALMRNNIYELVAESSAFSLVSLFVPLIAGLYWKRASVAGAIASMVVGLVVWLIAVQILPDSDPEHWPDSPTFGEILWHTPPMIWGLFASFAAMYLGSLWFPHAHNKITNFQTHE